LDTGGTLERGRFGISPQYFPGKFQKTTGKPQPYTVYPVRPGDLTPNGRKTFELFYDFLIILEI